MDKALELYFLCILDRSLTCDDYAELCVYSNVSDEDYLNAQQVAKTMTLGQIRTIAVKLDMLLEFNHIKDNGQGQ